MKFKKLILENFRQYYGRQELDLDTTDSKNIIVFYPKSQDKN